MLIFMSDSEFHFFEDVPGINYIAMNEYGQMDTTDSLGNEISIISASCFEDFVASLVQAPDSNKIILSPELITATGINFAELNLYKNEIEQRIFQILKISESLPSARIILGTPLWDSESPKPSNVVLLIQNGKIIQKTKKITNADLEEFETFDFIPDNESQNSVNTKTGILICSDLANAGAVRTFDFNNPKMKDLMGRMGKPWILQYSDMPKFIDPNWNTIFVPTIWGAGGNVKWADRSEPNEYYKDALITAVARVFKNFPNVQDIIVCDMNWPEDETCKGKVATKPLNYHFRRSSSE